MPSYRECCLSVQISSLSVAQINAFSRLVSIIFHKKKYKLTKYKFDKKNIGTNSGKLSGVHPTNLSGVVSGNSRPASNFRKRLRKGLSDELRKAFRSSFRCFFYQKIGFIRSSFRRKKSYTFGLSGVRSDTTTLLIIKGCNK